MAKISVGGSKPSDFAIERSREQFQRAVAAPPTPRDRRRAIVEQLDHLGITAFDLLSWDGMLELLELSENARSDLGKEIYKQTRLAADRRAAELSQTNPARADKYRSALARFPARVA